MSVHSCKYVALLDNITIGILTTFLQKRKERDYGNGFWNDR